VRKGKGRIAVHLTGSLNIGLGGRYATWAKVNRRAYAISQFQVSGYKIRVQMSQDHMLDLKFMFGSKFQIALDVTSGIDDGGSAGLLVTDQVRSVSEAN
jgi:hypothetical protein